LASAPNTQYKLPPGVQVLERGWLSANNILAVGRDQTALIDSGYCTHAGQTLALLDVALNGRDLDTLLNTHLHSDHCGGNAALQRRFPDVITRIPPGEAPAVRNWDESLLSYRATGQQCPRFRFNHLLVPGANQMLGDSAWQVHAAPGHDPHSVIFFEPETRTLVSADALWESGFGIVFPELIGESSFDEVAATLDLIEALSPLTVIPGHGPVFHDVAGALAVARQRLGRQASNPAKHARHAIKVLIKFKLMDVRKISLPQWREWISATPYFELVRRRFFADESLLDLASSSLEELIHAKAVRPIGLEIVDC
jgi:glyoxylase-like metal-dependent hydrolase (beta-lactamase superfamily II)